MSLGVLSMAASRAAVARCLLKKRPLSEADDILGRVIRATFGFVMSSTAATDLTSDHGFNGYLFAYTKFPVDIQYRN